MNNGVLGEYDFSNQYSINFASTTGIGVQTIIHEAHHMMFTLQTSYGIFFQSLNRISIIDSRFDHINKYLILHMRKMQESACTFIEALTLIENGTFEEAKSFIDQLRKTNKEYYKYIYPLLPLLDFIAENTDSGQSYKMPSKEMRNFVNELVITATDIDITQIDREVFRSPKKLKKFNSRQEISSIFHPNKRFNLLIKELITFLNKPIGPKDKEKEVYDFLDKNRCIIDEGYLNKVLYRNNEYLKALYYDSSDLDALIEVIDRKVVKSMDVLNLLGSGVPECANSQYSVEHGKSADDIIKIVAEHTGIIFILGDYQSLFAESSRYYYIPPNSHINDINYFFVTFFDYVDKRIYAFLCESERIMDFCAPAAKLKVPIVISYKIFDKLHTLFSRASMPSYVYCDRSYSNAVTIINKYARSNNKFELVSYGEHIAGLTVLVINVDQNSRLILPMVDASKIVLFRDVEMKNIDIIPGLEIDDKLLMEIDTIINCLFYY